MTKLYLVRDQFSCRMCHNLDYESRHADPSQRAMRKIQAIRRRLDGSTALLDPFPDRPKGMRNATYARLVAESQRAQEAFLVAIQEEEEKLAATLERL